MFKHHLSAVDQGLFPMIPGGLQWAQQVQGALAARESPWAQCHRCPSTVRVGLALRVTMVNAEGRSRGVLTATMAGYP